jgi:hypothetical protein
MRDTPLSVNRLSQGSLHRPPAVYAASERKVWYAAFVCPVSKCFCLFIESVKSINSFIAALLFFRGPSTVFRTVWTVRVNTVNRVMFGWARRHIINKVPEAIPSAVNSDPFCPVVLVGGRTRVETSLPHPCPDIPKGMRMNVLFFWEFTRTAIAAFLSGLEIASSDNNGRSALAETVPHSLLFSMSGDVIRSLRNYAQFSVDFICAVNKIVSSHFRTSIRFWLGGQGAQPLSAAYYSVDGRLI